MGVFKQLTSLIRGTEGDVVSAAIARLMSGHVHIYSSWCYLMYTLSPTLPLFAQAVVCENGRTRSASVVAAYLLRYSAGRARDFGLVKAELNAAMEHRGEQYRADRNGVYTPGACRKCSCVACC